MKTNNNNTVVLINQSTGYLMTGIVNAYCEKYDNVVLLAGEVRGFDPPINSKVKVVKTAKYNTESFYSRALSWIKATIKLFFILLFKYRNAFVVYVTNPPTSYFCSLLLKNRFAVVEYDIYPEGLLTIGMKPSNIIYKLWSSINRKVLPKAEVVFTLSTGMADTMKQYVDPNKVKVIPNWGSSSISKVNRRDNIFIKENNLDGKFVVLFTGNIGYDHHVEVLLDVAYRLRANSKIQFVIIGYGPKRDELVETAKTMNLSNCCFLDWQPIDKVKYSLSSANLSVITLSDNSALACVPSRTYNYLSVGSPLLCIGPNNSEVAKLIEQEQCGMSYERTEIENISAFIECLANDKLLQSQLSNNALVASTHYTSQNAKRYVI